jgi:hypothetical protein
LDIAVQSETPECFTSPGLLRRRICVVVGGPDALISGNWLLISSRWAGDFAARLSLTWIT